MKETPTSDDYKILAATIRMVFLYVSQSDGKLSDRELEVFRNEWKNKYTRENITEDKITTVDILISCQFELACRGPVTKISEQQFHQTMQIFEETLKRKFSFTQKWRIRRAIRSLAKMTAEAERRFLERRINKSEQEAINLVDRYV